MPMIKHIFGDGPELSGSQARVLQFLDSHPEHIYRLHNDDLRKIQQRLNLPETGGISAQGDGFAEYSLSKIRWAMSTLHGREKIGSIAKNRETYYGSHKAIEKADEELHKNAMKSMEMLERLTELASQSIQDH